MICVWITPQQRDPGGSGKGGIWRFFVPNGIPRLVIVYDVSTFKALLKDL